MLHIETATRTQQPERQTPNRGLNIHPKRKP